MNYAALIVIVLLGLAFGSFTNAWVWRTHAGLSVVKGRSRCPGCKHQLAWYDLVPVLSFVLLRGRCRYCRKPISIQYPLVEAATAVLFGLLYIYAAPSLNGPLGWTNLLILLSITVLLVATFVYDARYMLIPEKFVLPAIALGVLSLGIRGFSTGWEGLMPQLIGLGVVLSLYTALWYFSRGQWLGAGDIRLVAIMALFLQPKQLVVALFASYLLGAIYGVFVLAKSEKKRGIKVAFGPFLILGFYIGLFLGNAIAAWYLGFL